MKKYHRAIVIIFSFLITISSFSSELPKNDGNAFVTKSEFDNMKYIYQTKIDTLNANIDNNIDNAIASYLTGVTVTTSEVMKFDVAAGEKVLVANSDYVSGLKWNKAGIDYNISINAIANPRDHGATGVGKLTMTRNAVAGWEMFELNYDSSKADGVGDNNFDFYVNDGKLSVVSAFSQVKDVNTDNTVPEAGARFRWHATPFEACSLDRKNVGYKYYDDRITKANYYSFYGTMLNWGSGWLPSGYNNELTTEVQFTSDNKIKYILDDGSNSSGKSIWVIDPTKNKNCVVATYQSIYDTGTYSYDLPSGAGITSSLWLDITSDYSHSTDSSKNYCDYYHRAVTPTWTKIGDFNDETTSGAYCPWIELFCETVNKKAYEIKNNNITSDILYKYSSYGYKGFLTQGLPIGMLPEECTMEFTIDTTRLNTSCNLGFSTMPFVAATAIDSMPASTDFELSVNGIKTDKPYMFIPNGIHKIKIKSLAKGQKPIFWKIAYKRNSSANKREYITCPVSYEIYKTKLRGGG